MSFAITMAGLVSGIRCSDELLKTFAAAHAFEDDVLHKPVRLLKIQIEDNSMVVKTSVKKEGDEKNDFASVGGVLDEDVPCYILFKMDKTTREGWLLANWVPENTKVRQKMLYASSRETLKKEIGSAAVTAEMTATERDEITYDVFQRSIIVNEAERLSLMSETERALKHSANTHVDTGIPTKASYVHGVKFALSDEARDSISSLNGLPSCFCFLQLRVVREPKEEIVLEMKETLSGAFSDYKSAVCKGTEPRFSLYVLPGTAEGAEKVVVFCLYCPEDAAVKQKMLYSTAKSALVDAAAELQVSISIKLEVRESSDLAESDLVLPSEAAEGAAAPLPTMSRPRGPAGARGMIKLPGM